MRTLSSSMEGIAAEGGRICGTRANVMRLAIMMLLVLTAPRVDAFRSYKRSVPLIRSEQVRAKAASTTTGSDEHCATRTRQEQAEDLKQVAQELEGTFERSEDGQVVAVIEDTREQEKEVDAAETSDDQKEVVAESESADESDRDEVDPAVAEARRRRAAASLLGRSSGRRGTASSARKTSVGPARAGAASRARQLGGNKAAKIFKGLERAASAASTGQEKDPKKETGKKDNSLAADQPEALASSVMRSTIDGLILQKKQEAQSNVAVHVPRYSDMHRLLRHPAPGTILFDNELSRIRLATPEDDAFIADLRLSVFSDFGPAFRQQFNSRSQQVLASRRLRGATCLVATNIFSDERVVGSVEVSIHEFHGTLLGRSRLPESMLYITEVAVHPSSRRCGLGRKLLETVDKLARRRVTVESLYLHVDVTNTAAIRLYESCGYRRMDPALPMYEEFTRSLDLHDGATKGRKHYLLCKDIVPNPTWLLDEASPAAARPPLGFEVPQ